MCRPYGFEDIPVEGGCAPAWDRFRFDISLETYESSIQQRTMWFVGRYATAVVDGQGLKIPGGDKEWWDNNSGNNYRVAFVKRIAEVRVEVEEREKKQVEGGAGYRRNVVFSAPRECPPFFFALRTSSYTYYQPYFHHPNPSLRRLKFPLHFLILLE